MTRTRPKKSPKKNAQKKARKNAPKRPTTRRPSVWDFERQVDGLITDTAHLLDVTDPMNAEFLGAKFANVGLDGEASIDLLTDGLIPAIERRGGRDGLAFLLALGSVVPGEGGARASAAAERLAASGVSGPSWAAALAAPLVVGECLRLSDEAGDASMLVGSFDRAGSASHALMIAVNHRTCGAADDILLLYDDELSAALDSTRESIRRTGSKVVEERLEPAEWRWWAEQALDAREVHDDDWLAADPAADKDGSSYRTMAILLRSRLNALPQSSRPPMPHGGSSRARPVWSLAMPMDTMGQTVYRLKVSLRGAKPPIWRRLEVPSGVDLGTLHTIIQIAFDWDNSHLHVFQTPDASFGVPDEEDHHLDEESVTLAEVAPGAGSRLGYTYDFGDLWEHEILVEKELAADPTVAYPRCTGGRRAAPPEDCGGIQSYEMLTAAALDPTHPDHREHLDWLGLDSPEEFDPDHFDAAAVTKTLTGLR